MILCRDGRLVNNRFFEAISTQRHSVFTLQLQDLGGTILLCKLDLLWPSMFRLRFGMQL